MSKEREFFLNKEVSAESVEKIILGILEANRLDDENSKNKVTFERKPIKIIIDSYGGICYDGMTLANVMDTSETPIHTYCYGKAMSMGLTIFVAGHKRFAHPLATFMHHQLWGGTEGRLIDMVESVEQKKKLQDMLDDFIISKTKIKESSILKLRETKTDWFFTGKEAIDLGVADELITRQV